MVDPAQNMNGTRDFSQKNTLDPTFLNMLPHDESRIVSTIIATTSEKNTMMFTCQDLNAWSSRPLALFSQLTARMRGVIQPKSSNKTGSRDQCVGVWRSSVLQSCVQHGSVAGAMLQLTRWSWHATTCTEGEGKFTRLVIIILSHSDQTHKKL